MGVHFNISISRNTFPLYATKMISNLGTIWSTTNNHHDVPMSEILLKMVSNTNSHLPLECSLYRYINTQKILYGNRQRSHHTIKIKSYIFLIGNLRCCPLWWNHEISIRLISSYFFFGENLFFSFSIKALLRPFLIHDLSPGL